MSLDEFVQDIHDEITFSGSMPYSISLEEIKRIIKNSAKYFWDNWQYAVETRYMIVPGTVWKHEQFKQNRTILLPDCVAFVYDFKESKTGGSIFGTIDPDFSDAKFIGSELTMTPYIGESIMYRVVLMSFIDLAKSLTLNTISFKYNKNSRQLMVVGRTPRTDAVLKISKKLDMEDLLEDEMFQRYVRAKAKLRLGEMITNFDMPLPGDVKINYNNFINRADKEMTKVEEDMKGETSPNFMFIENY